MNKAQALSEGIESKLNRYAAPIKPWVPAIGRTLLVSTFLEDSFRIVTQWEDQTYYLENFQKMPNFVAIAFLSLNVFLMILGSGMIITRQFTGLASGILTSTVVLQSLGYGLISDMNFLLRNLSVVGGLLLLLSDSLSSAKKKDLFAGLPALSETSRSMYLQLAGRILLVALFFSFLLAGEMTIFRMLMSVVGLVVVVMVVIGFKAKYSAVLLVLFLSVANLVLNNWWNLHHNSPHRVKYCY